MIVCVCHRVSDREIVRHAHAGMNFDEIQFELGVATQCGNCESCVHEIMRQCSPMQPMAALHHESHRCSNQPATGSTGVTSWNLSQRSSPA
ncbi:(2Fe-2S)-binding protein [Lampropedia hyalina]|uniref:(2Fe-2S)-binding protein n=1 Tax=Lampropedia hyalina TaxID=198706 RepID=UPI000934A3E9|nr:(2Fe-2S)-binding protein [Lampropedia hyalina]